MQSRLKSLLPELSSPETGPWLQRLGDHHAETLHHSVRVARWCRAFALRFGPVEVEDRRVLIEGALLHDIGKLRVPASILAKPAELTAPEWALIRMHPRYGFELTRGAFDERVRRIIVGHHELKHAPYPRARGMDSFDTLDALLVSIVSVADIYDALRYRRAYKEPLPLEDVRELLGQQFSGDPLIPARMVAVGTSRRR